MSQEIDLREGKVLVTGGTGFIGSRVVRKLISEGTRPENIRVLYYPNSPTSAIDDLKVELFPADIIDEQRVQEAVIGCKHVFHLVGNTAMEKKAKKIQWLINVEGTLNVLMAAEKANVEKIVYTSTVNALGCPHPDGSLGNEETSPYKSERPEIGKKVPKLHSFDTPQEALDFADAIHKGSAPKKWWKKIGIGYYDSKLAAQEIVNRFHKEKGLAVTSVLPGTCFGPGDDQIGFGLMLIRLRQNTVPGYLKRHGLPLMHVDDQATGHYLAMQKGRVGERYCITGKESDNKTEQEMMEIMVEILREKEPDRKIKVPKIGLGKLGGAIVGTLLDFIANFQKKPLPIGKDSIRAGSHKSYYSYEKAKRELNYSPIRDFSQAISEMYEYYKERGYLELTERRGLVADI